MNQQLFDQLTQGSGAKYFPNIYPGDYYELKAIEVGLDSYGGNFIYVNVLDANGQPAFNVKVRNAFGAGGPDEREDFSSPAQFNIGPGSHYTEPNDPPQRISVLGLNSDSVHLGNSNMHGFGHIQAKLTFQKVSSVTPPPPPSTGGVTEAQVKAWINEALERGKFP